jgi:hypothetical protein
VELKLTTPREKNHLHIEREREITWKRELILQQHGIVIALRERDNSTVQFFYGALCEIMIVMVIEVSFLISFSFHVGLICGVVWLLFSMVYVNVSVTESSHWL